MKDLQEYPYSEINEPNNNFMQFLILLLFIILYVLFFN